MLSNVLKRLSTVPKPTRADGEHMVEVPLGKEPESPIDVNTNVTVRPEQKPSASSAISNNFDSIPVRLVLLSEFIKLSQEKIVPFYEILPKESYIEVNIDEFITVHSKETAAISWRWEEKKPQSQKEAEARLKSETSPCPPRLVEKVMRRLGDDPHIRYIWLDWCCAPQFGGSPIPEVSRSGIYFQHAKRMIICSYDTDDEGTFAFSDYFARTWPMAERLSRARSTDHPLLARDLLPLTVIESLLHPNAKPLSIETCGPPWGVLMASAIAKLRLSTSSNNKGGFIPEIVNEFVFDTVCGRYPLISRTLTLVEDRESVFAKVFTSETLAALSLCLRVRAIGEWARFPDPADDVCQVVQFNPPALKTFLFEVTIRQSRSALAAIGDKTSPLLVATDAFFAVEELLKTEHEKGLDMLDERLPKFVELVLQQKGRERPSISWLRQYLLHSSAQFEASFEPDKVFALYRLFDLPVRSSYEEVEKVWRELAVKTGLERTPIEVFGWIRDLAEPPLSPEDELLEFFFAENKRTRLDLSSFDPRNFGVFSFPPLFCRQKLTMETLFLHPDVAKQTQVLSYLVGFSLDERAAAKLGKKNDYKTLGMCAEETVETFSLGEQKMISFLESRIHELIRRCFSLTNVKGPFVTKDHNGLFILARYHGVSHLCHVLVLRTACYSENQWTLECVGGFTTPEPLSTRSSRGIALVLQHLISDVASLDSDLGIHLCVKHKGTCAPFAEVVQVREDAVATGTKAKIRDDFVTSWELNGDYNPERGESTFHGGLLLKKNSMDVGDLVVFGKTTFDSKTEFNRLQKASQLIAQDGGSNEALAKYYHLLQRNYVHDTIMAQRIEYFGELCAILAHHIETLPVLLEDEDIRESCEYFCEDLQDALAMAQSNIEGQAMVDKARAAVERLSLLLRQ